MVAEPHPSRPDPDPTQLTTQQLLREIALTRELFDSQMSGLRELHQEKFHSIEIQFTERDKRASDSARDSKTAVDAALQAAKEAVGKSEVSTTKQIENTNETGSGSLSQLNRTLLLRNKLALPYFAQA